MSIIKKTGLVIVLGIFIIITAVSCGGGTTTETVTPTDYSSVKDQLEDIKSQLTSVQKDLVEAQLLTSEHEALKSDFDELQTEYEELSGDFDALKAQYDALINSSGSADEAYQELMDEYDYCVQQLSELQPLYNELKAEHDLRVQQEAEVTADNIAAALFEAINYDRINNGLPSLLPGTNINGLAYNISVEMSKLKQLIYDNNFGISCQNVYQATGYRSVDDLVNATMTIWKSEAVRYQINNLNTSVIYGTVQVVELDGIFYITFLAWNYP